MVVQCKYPQVYEELSLEDSKCYNWNCWDKNPNKCPHSEPHEQTPACFVKCCSVHSKDIRCIRLEQ